MTPSAPEVNPAPTGTLKAFAVVAALRSMVTALVPVFAAFVCMALVTPEAVMVQLPPRAQDWPLTVVEELVSPALLSVPERPSCTFPALVLVKVRVMPFVAAEFSRFSAVCEELLTVLV